MKNLIISSLVLVSALWAQVIVIPIDKEIEPGLYTFLKRAVKDAEAQNPEAIVFEINTFGGRVDAALDIVELISNIKIRTVGVVKEKAISAGCLIALSCRELYMMENTTLGDVAPIMQTKEGPEMLGEKFQSPLRAKFRALAEKNGYPIKLTEALVSSEKEIIEITDASGAKRIITGVEYNDLTESEKKKIVKKRTIVPKGELLTMSATEAATLGFSKKTVKTLEEVVGLLQTKSQEIRRIEKKRSERLLIFMNGIAPILILIGLAGIYMEIKTPGFGMWGIIGITAFLLFFSIKHIVGLADYIELVLFLVGIALLFVELFVIPGFGIIGVVGIGFLLASVLLAMQSFVIPKMPWDFVLFKSNLMIVGILFLISIPLFFLALFSTSRLVFASRLGHHTSEQTSEGFGPAADSSILVGKEGRAATPLRPAGTAIIENKRYDVVADGEFIEMNEPVVVSETVGNRIVVRKA